MKVLILIVLFFVQVFCLAHGKNKTGDGDIIYKYKKYQKFDFEDLNVKGEGSPGDLSLRPRFKRKFKNRLPYRKNFNPEIRRSLERVR